MFEGRKLLIATKHEKEKVIAPILEKELGVKCILTTNFDTDQLGTFTGEVERLENPIATARKKCLLAMELTNTDLAVASEGSFGPHPTYYFISADDEFLIFIDKKNGLEIIVREISTETNFNGSDIKTEKDLMIFANNVNFPSHKLILRKSKDDFNSIIKGIDSEELLKKTFHQLKSSFNQVYVETDMRAMNNPTRMKVIEQATVKLVVKIKLVCPNCNAPGFGITDSKPGLPCELCGSPTKSAYSHISTCKKCGYLKEEKNPNGKKFESATYCDHCNP
jgi:hypothetical protein